MMMKKQWIALMIALAFAATPATAGVGVKIGGNATSTVNAKNIMNGAMGKNARAEQKIGGIDGKVNIGKRGQASVFMVVYLSLVLKTHNAEA